MRKIHRKECALALKNTKKFKLCDVTFHCKNNRVNDPCL